jgi:hypothetical protein
MQRHRLADEPLHGRHQRRVQRQFAQFGNLHIGHRRLPAAWRDVATGGDIAVDQVIRDEAALDRDTVALPAHLVGGEWRDGCGRVIRARSSGGASDSSGTSVRSANLMERSGFLPRAAAIGPSFVSHIGHSLRRAMMCAGGADHRRAIVRSRDSDLSAIPPSVITF